MTHAQFESLSNQAVAVCAGLYFLALIAMIAASVNRPRRVAPARELVGAGAPVESTDETTGDQEPDRAYRVELFERLGVAMTTCGAVVHLLALVARGLASDPRRVPWGNMYEFTLTATFVVVALFLVMYRRFRLAWMAPIVTFVVLAVLMLDVLVLYEPVTPLRDALQSPWLVIHVVAAIIATGAFTIGGICSVLYLVKTRAVARGATGGYLSRVPAPDALERMSYRWHAFAFPLWTFAALIAGPIWAENAWGSYWSWDPKEVWAFITWVVYAGYLHARSTGGWRGTRSSVVALIGLATLWFNFIGINFFFGSGSQHSYAAPEVRIVQTVGHDSAPSIRP